MTREAAARKARALLATAAAGSGATDPERSTARRLAEGLIRRHALTRADLLESPPPRTFERVPRAWTGFTYTTSADDASSSGSSFKFTFTFG